MSNGEAAPPAPPPPPLTSSTPQATPQQPSKAAVSALVIDDEPANCDFLVRLLQQTGMAVQGAGTGEEALALAGQAQNLALVVIDHRLPDMSGVELLAQLRTRFPTTMMVMATMHDERTLMDRAFETGCDVFLVKPHGFMELFKRLKAAPLTGENAHERLIIDQYGPRPYRG